MVIVRYLLIGLLFFSAPAAMAQQPGRQVRVIMIGAHPDDCDIKGGGTAILFASMGHAVKFVSVTNGDAGHQSEGGGMLAKRRLEEAKEAGRRFGVEYDVLDNHDGELEPSLKIRLQIIRKIREWDADIVIAPRPNDYHPDHRYTGVLVQDAAYMVGVPNIAPDVSPLKKNPVFLYFQDHFRRPNPFRPDITVDISSVFEKKIHALDAHQSQFYEWLPWIGGYAQDVPGDAKERKTWLTNRYTRPISEEVRTSLEKYYGKQKSQAAKYTESFEICEYGTQPDETIIKTLFPMLGK
ncbi:MAG: PIG-L family deacetylase [Chitinophagaceae bacterium]|nr:PIG-L family deacetylase [Chitinophagaceae bacterium]MCW5926557.1 PIG-L family deacetylase [Chitinophagaceae bacterium]